MTIPAGKAPILQSVRAAIALWRTAVPRLAPLCAAGGALSVLVQLLAQGGGQAIAAPLALVVLPLIIVFVYTSFLRHALDLPTDFPARARAAVSVAGAMALIGAFLFLVFLVAGMPGANIFLTGAGVDIQSVPEDDVEAAMRVMEQALYANPLLAAIIFGGYAVIWFFLTSRLYIAAPASAAENRVRTFETWAWTKDNMLRITAARLILVVPAFLFFNLLGPRVLMLLASASPVLAIGVQVVIEAAVLAVAWGLEACLSAYLYKGLRPPAR
ncbi:MAG: hypothetical protein GC206_15990 [Alphaproteobacteria bacterium]|nr:hypothetical protein [Alphaproteobacteria bacterium]